MKMSGKGKFNLVALAVTILAAFLLFLTAPEAVGVTKTFDQFLPQQYYGFKGILNML